MRKFVAIFSLVVATSGAPLLIPQADAAIVYRSGEGWSAEDEDSGNAEATAAEQLRKAERLEAENQPKKALGAYRTLVRNWPQSIAAQHAQIKIADLYQSLGHSERAFKEYGVYLEKYPKGAEFERAVETQFQLATSFLEGERRKVLGVKTLPSMQRAAEMFADILKRAPYSKWAALSQFNIGRAMEKQDKWPEAVAAYQMVVDKYPADEIAADAQYQIGYIYYTLAKSGSNDFSARHRAREAYEDFIMRFPDSEKVAQAQENLKQLGDVDTRKTLDIGRYYQKTGNPKAAVIYFEEVINSDPGSDEAKTAQKLIDQLRSIHGDDALRSGPERAETGSKAKERRKMRALVETSSRPDFNGPPAPPAPPEPDEVAPARPEFRTFPDVEPPLPADNNQPPVEDGLLLGEP